VPLAAQQKCFRQFASGSGIPSACGTRRRRRQCTTGSRRSVAASISGSSFSPPADAHAEPPMKRKSITPSARGACLQAGKIHRQTASAQPRCSGPGCRRIRNRIACVVFEASGSFGGQITVHRMKLPPSAISRIRRAVDVVVVARGKPMQTPGVKCVIRSFVDERRAHIPANLLRGHPLLPYLLGGEDDRKWSLRRSGDQSNSGHGAIRQARSEGVH